MNEQLRIDSLSVTNYRCFRRFDEPIRFEPELTVLVARNGEGKTAFLDAVKIALGIFTTSFPVGTQAHFQHSDVHIGGNPPSALYPVTIETTGMIDSHHERWSRSLLKAKGRTVNKDAKALSEYGRRLWQKIQDDEPDVALPIIAFYGTGRLWGNTREQNAGPISPLAETRFAGYENALSARATYAQTKGWLLEAIRTEDSKEASTTKTGQHIISQLNAVKKALRKVGGGEGLEKLHYNSFFRDEISVVSTVSTPEGTVPTALPISWLSDGVRAVFSLVADIAYRCAKLNPHLGEDACEKTNGIVMIDEVDIFLHPAWQQRILGDLHAAFPNIQFIVTTHSPQVVSTVPRESVRIIDAAEVVPFDMPTVGVGIGDILAGIFGTHPTPQNTAIAQKVNRLHAMLSEGLGDTPEWKCLYAELEGYFGKDYPPLKGALKHRDFLRTMQKEEGNGNA